MISPVLSRGHRIICDSKRTVSCAARSRGFRGHQLGLVDRNKPRFGLLLVLLAIVDHRLEAVIDLARQQILQRTAIAVGESQHDHLVGAAGARRKCRGSNAGSWAAMASRPAASGVAGSAMPFQRSVGGATSPLGARRRLIDHGTRHRNDVAVVLRPLNDVRRGAIIGRPFAPGALSEDAAQAQKDEDRQRQEDDGVNIHVVFAFWF